MGGEDGTRNWSDAAGRVNAMSTRINWGNEMESVEAEVVSIPNASWFVSEGELGAMALNEKNEWVGMLMGLDGALNTGYITPVQDLIDDIKIKTGGTISLA